MFDISQLGYKIKSEKDLQKCLILRAVDYDYK